MPGMAIILAPHGKAELEDALTAMLAPITFEGHQTATLVDATIGIAAGHTAPRHTGGSTVGYAADGQIAALVEGEHLGLPPEPLGSPVQSVASRADQIAALYARAGAAGLEKLRGHWAVVILDRARNTITIANDAFGIRPLFRMSTPDGACLIATSPAAILAHPRVERGVDPAGLADYLAFGYPLGRHTLFRSMERLAAATVLQFKDRSLQERVYWLPVMQQERGFGEADLEAMRCSFNDHVLQVAAQCGPASLALSGGGDSRALLSALIAGGLHVDTLTHAIADATDACMAQDLAQVAGARHHFYETRGEDIAPHVVEGVRMLAGQAAGIEAHPLAFLPEYPTFTCAMLTGLGGNLYKGNFLTGEPESRHTSVAELARWLTARHNYLIHTYNDFEPLLTADWCAALKDQPHRSVMEVLDRQSPETPVCRRSVVFYLQERASKYLVKGDNYVRREIEARHPFMDRELLLRSWRFPSQARARGLLQSYIITRNAPQLLDVAVTYAAGSGWPLRRYTRASLGRLTSYLAHLQETLRERRRPSAAPVPNYRYGEWLRGAFRPLVETVLLDPGTLARPYFRPETIQKWVSEHMAGQKRGDKLSALLSLELTLRAFVDKPPLAV